MHKIQNSCYSKYGKTKSKKYCENNNEKLHQQSRNRYRNIQEEEKDIKTGCGRNKYKNTYKKEQLKLRKF